MYYLITTRYVRLEDRYKKQLRKETDSLQRENETLREQLEKWWVQWLSQSL